MLTILFSSEKLKSMLLMAIRATSLGVKFALTLYIAKFMSLEDLGFYGLLVSATMIIPTIIGLSLMYTISRKAVTQTEEELSYALTHYWKLSGSTYLLIGVFATIGGFYFNQPYLVLICWLIIWLEHWNSEMYTLLLNLSKPLLSNILHAVRSLVWMVIFIGVSFFFPEFRSIESLLLFWAVGSLIALMGAFNHMKIWRWNFKSNPIPFIKWLKEEFRLTRVNYANYITLTCYQYSDRYLIGIFLGLEMTGVYVFFWQISSALTNLLNTGVVQIATPKMVKAFKFKSPDYTSVFKSATHQAYFFSILGATATLIFIYALLPYLDKPLINEWMPLLWLFMFGFVFNVQNNVKQLIFYSQHKDKEIFKINLLLFIPIFICTFTLIPLFGLWGAATCYILSAVFKLGLQHYFIRKEKLLEIEG